MMNILTLVLWTALGIMQLVDKRDGVSKIQYGLCWETLMVTLVGRCLST